MRFGHVDRPGAVARPGWVLAARLHIDLLRVTTALCPAPAVAVRSVVTA
ncbi:hypothetical protein [Kitasatospora sp. CB02891]|nr:hypothetical protein [Kitasatospora sp. CB02891]